MRRFPWLESVLVGDGFALQALLTAFVLTGGWLVYVSPHSFMRQYA
ncbi:MAG TPA: hypothetical protein VFN11_19385 [Ktedonobacterales bacterium]|nr:hypothetical protein [Ktedonobacterales bacterium]